MKTVLAFILAFLWSISPIEAHAVTIAFVGDSLTEGLGVTKEEAYPSLLEKKFKAKGLEVKIVNAGVSGSTSASAPARVKWILKTKPEWLVLALGANDGLRGLPTAEMKKNLEAAIVETKKTETKLFLAGIKVPPNYGPKYAREFDAVFSSLAKKYHLPWIPFLLEDVGGHTDLNQADGIHPNPKGHEKIAAFLFQKLEPLLRLK